MPLPDKQVIFLEQNCTDKESVDKTIAALLRGNKIKYFKQKHEPEEIREIIKKIVEI